jgi:hypothetical protein
MAHNEEKGIDRRQALECTARVPGPLLVPAGELRGLLGIRTVAVRQSVEEPAVTDISLAS